MSSSPTQALAAFVATSSPDTLPARLFDRARDLLIDHLGVSLAAVDLPWSQMIRAQVLEEGGRAESTVYGGGCASARNAALANGTMAHGIELDDTHIPSASHMSAVVFPAALAVAEARGADGRDFLSAYILGCDVMGRVGRAAGPPLLDRGFHPTAACGAFGAAAAAGVLMKLTPAQLSNAFGIALSAASGSWQFSLDPEGTMVKRLHGGLPAERGVLAAQLAARGYSGPAKAIEGELGFLNLFAGHREAAPVVADLGAQFMIEDMSVKVNACCLHFASLVDALKSAAERLAMPGEAIERIEVFGPKALLSGHMEYRPRSVMAAQYSLPYVAAATLLLDARDPRSFGEEAMRRADVLALGDRVSAREDATLQRLYPAKFPAGVRITLKNGATAEAIVEDAIGTAGRPITRSEIAGKFKAITPAHAAARQDALIEAAIEVDRPGGLARLSTLLRSAAPERDADARLRARA